MPDENTNPELGFWDLGFLWCLHDKDSRPYRVISAIQLAQSLRMKACGYCGRGNGESADYCCGCGTSLVVNDSVAAVPDTAWPPWLLALKTGTAAVLVCTGVYAIVGKLLFDANGLDPRTPADILQGTRVVGYFMPKLVGFPLGIGAILFTVLTCRARCRRRADAVITASLAVGFMIVLKFLRCLAMPALAIGVLTNSSVGFYAASGLQVVFGFWLHGFFGRHTTKLGDAPPDSHAAT